MSDSINKQRAKRGLTGDTGLTGNATGVVHITAPYGAADDECFITDYPEWAGPFGTWEREKLSVAIEKDLEIINCCQCSKPATKLDHHHPMMSGMTLCDTCKYDPEYDR